MSGSSTGDKLEDLYLCHGPEALRLAYLLTGDRELAEDLAQEAFVRVARRLTGLRDAGAVRWYLRRTVVNLAHSHLRRRVERAHMPVLVSSVALAGTGAADVATTQAVRMPSRGCRRGSALWWCSGTTRTSPISRLPAS